MAKTRRNQEARHAAESVHPMPPWMEAAPDVPDRDKHVQCELPPDEYVAFVRWSKRWAPNQKVAVRYAVWYCVTNGITPAHA
jgi:hypothetical protein